jgi:hypothetical protein
MEPESIVVFSGVSPTEKEISSLSHMQNLDLSFTLRRGPYLGVRATEKREGKRVVKNKQSIYIYIYIYIYI